MQAAFDFYDELPKRPARPERLFFALFPGAERGRDAMRFAKKFQHANNIGAKLLRADRLHVSLHHVGDYKILRPKFTYAASLAAASISIKPFQVTFRFIESFEGPPQGKGEPPKRPLVLLGEGGPLTELHDALGAALREIGLKAAETFTPHMTLSYGPDRVPRQAIDPISFTADRFDLIHSRLWLTQYRTIDSWQLHG
jgi:RNA 2',3'-cyclic 3'-phosphodiesterase